MTLVAGIDSSTPSTKVVLCDAADGTRTFGCVRLVWNKAPDARTAAWYQRQERVTYVQSSALLTEWKQSDDLAFLWILGSSGGESAQAAGKRGLRFAANYHVSPAGVLEAVDGYRAAFRPSAELSAPHVSVSADVVVADDEATARELATGYGLWVRSIRTGQGAIPFPVPGAARAHIWSDEDRALVADRTDTQFVGTPGQVADKLEQLRDATEAGELIVTTITHRHADRVRSHQLLAEEWQRR